MARRPYTQSQLTPAQAELTPRVHEWAAEELPEPYFRKVLLIRITGPAAFPTTLAFTKHDPWQTEKILAMVADGYVVDRTWIVTPEAQAAAAARIAAARAALPAN